MTMRMVLLGVSAGLLVLSSPATSQQTLKDTLQTILDSLEYPTRSFDSRKETWVVTDQSLITEVLSAIELVPHRFDTATDSVKAALPVWTAANDRGDVEVVCKRRPKDQEIGWMQLRSDGLATATFRDYVLIHDLLGEALYAEVRQQRDNRYDARQKRRYDIFLHVTDPRILLWSQKPSVDADTRSYTGSWYAVYAFGRLGNDHLSLPFWYRGTVIGGLRLVCVDDLLATPDRDYSLYTLTLGWEEPMNFSVKQDRPSQNSMFRPRLMEGIASAVYLAGSYTPHRRLNLLSDNKKEHLSFTGEISLAIENRESVSTALPETFYAIRNYATVTAELRHAGLFNYSVGISWHDLYHYSRVEVPGNQPSLLEPSSNHFLTSLLAGIGDDGDEHLVSYDVAAGVNFDVTDGFGFFVVRSSVLLGNIVGVEVKYLTAFRAGHLPPWHYNNYILFSPIIRINY